MCVTGLCKTSVRLGTLLLFGAVEGVMMTMTSRSHDGLTVLCACWDSSIFSHTRSSRWSSQEPQPSSDSRAISSIFALVPQPVSMLSRGTANHGEMNLALHHQFCTIAHHPESMLHHVYFDSLFDVPHLDLGRVGRCPAWQSTSATTTVLSTFVAASRTWTSCQTTKPCASARWASTAFDSRRGTRDRIA